MRTHDVTPRNVLSAENLLLLGDMGHCVGGRGIPEAVSVSNLSFR
jgi:hypothetical protein